MCNNILYVQNVQKNIKHIMFHLRKVGLMRIDCLACIYLRFFLFSYYVDLKVAGPIKNVVILVLLMSIDSINCTEDQCQSHMDLYKKMFTNNSMFWTFPQV